MSRNRREPSDKLVQAILIAALLIQDAQAAERGGRTRMTSPRVERPKTVRGRPRVRPYKLEAPPTFLNIKEAAKVLRINVEALRARCRRAAVKGKNGNVTARLAPGVVAVKFGETWRVRFEKEGGR